MVRVIKTNQVGDKWHYEVFCLSTDTKPTEDVLTGSTACEVDTGDVYMFDEVSNTWVKQMSLQA